MKFYLQLKNSMRPFILLILSSLFYLSCQKHERNEVSIDFFDKEIKGKPVIIRIVNPLNLEADTIAKAKADSMGVVKVNFSTTHGFFGDLVWGTRAIPMYFENGYEIKIRPMENSSDYSFSGLGSAPNNYIQKVTQIRSEIELLDGKNSFEVDEAGLLKRLSLLEKGLEKLKASFKDSSLNERTTDLLERRNKVIFLSTKQAYGWNRSNNYRTPSAFDVISEIPQDPLLLESKVIEYGILLQMNITLNYIFSAIRDRPQKEVEFILGNAPMIIGKKIQEDTLSPLLKEFMLAKNVDYMLSLNGRTKSLDSTYGNFKRTYPNSVWNSDLLARYKKYLALDPGNLAPVINGVTVAGEKFLSTDLKGKIVYVDIWATWCGPCVAEIPESIKLQRAFEDKNDVAFLNVSVDSNEKGWKEKLIKENMWKGVHILNDRTVYKSYLLSGIPHYILIDKAGKIVSSNAPRPSSGKVKSLIDSLLYR